jgi:hypothetical protein
LTGGIGILANGAAVLAVGVLEGVALGCETGNEVGATTSRVGDGAALAIDEAVERGFLCSLTMQVSHRSGSELKTRCWTTVHSRTSEKKEYPTSIILDLTVTILC